MPMLRASWEWLKRNLFQATVLIALVVLIFETITRSAIEETIKAHFDSQLEERRAEQQREFANYTQRLSENLESQRSSANRSQILYGKRLEALTALKRLSDSVKKRLAGSVSGTGTWPPPDNFVTTLRSSMR